MINHWYPYHSGDIGEINIQCLIEECGHEGYYVYQRLIDLSIKGNGIIRYDSDKLALMLRMRSTKACDRFEKIMFTLDNLGLIEIQDDGSYKVSIVYSRLQDAQNPLTDEKVKKLVDEASIDLAMCDYLDLSDSDLIAQPIVQLLHRYSAEEITTSAKAFADKFFAKPREERIIEDKSKYFFKSMLEIMRKPAVSLDEVGISTFIGLLSDADYITDDDSEQYQKIWDKLLVDFKAPDILFATRKFLENIVLNETPIENKPGYLISTLIKILRGTAHELHGN